MTQKNRKLPSTEIQRASLIVPRDTAKNELQDQIYKGEVLLNIKIKNNEDLEQAKADYYIWHDYNQELLRRIVDNNELLGSYKRTVFLASLGNTSFSSEVNEFYDDVKFYIRRLTSIIQRLDLIPELEGTSNLSGIKKSVDLGEIKVFIVHGHDEESKQSVARCIKSLGLIPIILQEQPNQGRTIIEKFEDYSDVSFAIVLLTPDDVGSSKDNKNNPSSRARQNVILELGFFIGRLGRNKVCALHKGNLELPSDISGIIWEPLDDRGAWKYAICKEMKAAGLDIDLNRLV